MNIPTNVQLLYKICFSSLSVENHNQLKEMALSLGAQVSDNFTTDINILVTSTVNSKKYSSARKKRIIVATPEWIKESFKNHFFLNPEEFRLPIFSGIIVLFFGFENDEQNKLFKIIEKYSGKMFNLNLGA